MSTNISYQKLAEVINREFNFPGLRDSHSMPEVKAWINNRQHFCLRIGLRDIEIDDAGTIMGAGTILRCQQTAP